MDKKSFYDIGHSEEGVPSNSVKNITNTVSKPGVSNATISLEAPHLITQGENIMAEVDTTQLSQEHGAIRHDIAVESARISAQVGSEICGVNKHIGDMRQEDAENFGHTRRDIQSTSADAARQMAAGFSDTRYNIAEHAGDIRQENARNFADGRFAAATQTADVRRELGLSAGEIIKEGLKGDFETIKGIKDTRFDLSSDINVNADRLADRVTETQRQLTDRFFIVGRDTAEIKQGQATLAKDVELNALKTQLDAKQNTVYLADKIVNENEKTRALINDLKYHDLNRGLVERNTALVNCEQDRRLYRDRWDDSRFNQIQAGFQGQWAQLQSQIQAFQSQLQETRQGLVNFGTMDRGAGTQSSTSNNVR